MTKWKPILAYEYERPVELIEVYTAEIRDKRKTSELLEIVCRCWPLAHLSHLKRVRKSSKQSLHILLCEKRECGDSVKQALLESFSQFGVSEALDWLREFQMTTVPRYAPLTRQQFETSSLHWSTSFHENKRVTQALSGQNFSKDDLDEMNGYTSFAVAVAREGKRLGKGFDGAVIVDPALGKILAVACDHSIGADPLQTAVMVCIDLVAQGQGGGVYNLGRECESTEPVLQGCTIDKLFLDVKWERSDLELIPRGKGKTKQPGSIIPYLCTGYDLYAAREPSVMCAMALVHSRIGRVFYREADSGFGGLGSCHRIHVQKGLNHRYEVYRQEEQRAD